MKTSMAVSVQKTSFQAIGFEESLFPLLKMIQQLGFDGAELAVRNPDEVDIPLLCGHLSELSFPVPAIGTGQAYLDEGLSLSALYPSVATEAKERLKDHIRLASRLQSLVIIGLVRGELPEKVDLREKAKLVFMENLYELCLFARASQVDLVLEPLNRYETNYLNTLEEAARCIEALGVDNLGILADTFHMNIEEISLAESLVRFGPLIKHVHLADSNRWAPGQGHLDFAPVLRALGDIGYRGFYSVEIIPHPSLDEAARQARNFFLAQR